MEVAPDGTVAVEGILTAVLLEETETVVPPVGAGPVRVMVQVLESPPARVAGAQPIEETAGGWITIEADAETPLDVAVMDALTLPATGEVVVEKDPAVAPAVMVTLGGTVAEAALLARLTGIPPVGAGPESVTAHVLAEPPVTVAGVQTNEEGAGAWMLRDVFAETPR